MGGALWRPNRLGRGFSRTGSRVCEGGEEFICAVSGVQGKGTCLVSTPSLRGVILYIQLEMKAQPGSIHIQFKRLQESARNEQHENSVVITVEDSIHHRVRDHSTYATTFHTQVNNARPHFESSQRPFLHRPGCSHARIKHVSFDTSACFHLSSAFNPATDPCLNRSNTSS